VAALTTLVDTDGVSGDYASMNAAIVGDAQDLTDGGGDTWECTCQATTGVQDTTAVEVAGWTTGSANWMKFVAASGQEADKSGLDTGIYRFGTSGTMLDVYEDYVYFSKLQFYSMSAANMFRINSVGASNYIEIDSCYFNGSGGAANEQCIICIDATAVVKIINTYMFEIQQRCIDLDAGTMSIYNCVFRAENARAGIDTAVGSTITVKNTAVINTADDFAISGTGTLDYNISDDGDGSHAQTPSGADWDNEYTDSANGDFTAITGGNIEGGGIGPSVDGNVPALDFDGDTRSGAICDIGADEIVAAGGTVPFTPLSGPFGGPFARPF